MSVRQVLAAGWSELLNSAGLDNLAVLLGSQSELRGISGVWTPMTKPDLGGRERWRWEVDSSDGTRVVFVKRYRRTSLKEQLDRFARQSSRHSRAWWEYEQSARLSAAYIPVPAAVGAVEEMFGPFERRSAVLLEQVPGDAFDRVWSKCAADDAPITRGLARHDMARRLGRFVSAFHQTGYCHRDLYLCHIFVELDAGGERPPAFWLIDLARTHRPRIRRMRWVLKDLSQLDYAARQIGASRADRMRFLEAYLGLQRGTPRIRWYAARILRRSHAILRRERRKGRA